MNGNANTAFKELKKSANSSQAAQPKMEIKVDGALTTDSAAILTRFAERFFPIEGVSDDSRWIFFNMKIISPWINNSQREYGGKNSLEKAWPPL